MSTLMSPRVRPGQVYNRVHFGNECTYVAVTPNKGTIVHFSFALPSYSLETPDTGTLLCELTHECQTLANLPLAHLIS